MANQKSNIHNIQLNTTSLNLNKYKSEISQYEGFNTLNSPYYGGVLSPFYYKEMTIVAESFIDKYGNIYNYKDNNFYKNDTLINKLDEQKALTKIVITDSGNADYYNILGFVSYNTEQLDNDDLALCSDVNGNLALVYVTGTRKGQLYKTTTTSSITVSPFPKVVFIKALETRAVDDIIYNSFVACIDNAIIVLMTNSNTDELVIKQIWSGTTVNHYMFWTGDSNHKNYFTCAGGTFKINEDNTVEQLSLSVKVINNIFSTTVNMTSYNHFVDFMIDFSGNVSFYNKQFGIQTKGSYVLPNSGKITGYSDDGVLQIKTTGCYIVGGATSTPSFTVSLLGDDPFSNPYSAVALTSNTLPDCSSTSIDKTKTILNPIIKDGAIIDYKKYSYQDVNVDKSVSAGYYTAIVDPGAKQAFIGTTAEYKGGTIVSVGDCFRLLFHNNILQSVSVYDTTDSIGTLLCGMSEINSDAPISYKNSQLYYKDSSSWIKVTASIDNTRKYTIINDRYILLNTATYYNCYDIETNKWHHFASDYNDRCYFTFDYTAGSIQAFTNNVLSATAQSANYEVLNNPFISSCYSVIISTLPKNSTLSKTFTIAAYTPDNVDVDIYYSLQSATNIPDYKYSQDGNSVYINQKLLDTNYAFDFTIIPSIFAEFINGFNNQSIIIDNNHSYLQTYANTTKPVFAMAFNSQLEGVTATFIIQGQYFVIINNVIYKYDESISAVINIGNMLLLGYTPYQALFYSTVNKTIYSFVGDNTLTAVIQVNNIGDIFSSFYNPNTCNIYILATTGIYIFTSNQLIRLNKVYKKGYITNNGVAFTNGINILFISYDKQTDYKKLPIELETKLYGEGNCIKSIYDCVYIRLFDEDKSAGKITISSKTLNEDTWQTEEKEFAVTTDMWDKDSKTLFIRYQPKYQEATGFAVSIKSPFSIATLDISATPITVSNSKNNI